MDAQNRFATKVIYRLLRLEWLAALGVASVLAIMHWHEIRWAVFVGLFLVIDLAGYLPGALAYRRSRTGQISRGYYVAYNVMHSLVTGAALVGGWALFVEPEWALLAVPIHLTGDRGLFGNSLKSFRVQFEPHPLPEFVAFESTDTGQTTSAVPVPTRPRPADGSPISVINDAQRNDRALRS